MEELPNLSPLTSKSALSRKLKISLRSIHNYHDIALIYVDDFADEYPILDGRRLTSHPLNIYQCWVLLRIKQFLASIPNSELLKSQLENDPSFQCQFSKEQFERLYPEVATDANQGILKAS